MATMDVEMVVGLADGAGQSVGMKQADEPVIAGVLVHEVGPGKVHGGDSQVSRGLAQMRPANPGAIPAWWLTEFAS